MTEIKQWQDHKGKVIDSVKDFDVIDCETCGFKHIIPLRDEIQAASYYENEFYQAKGDYIKNHTEDLEWWTVEHNEKYDLFDHHLNKHASKKIMDIGSGPGYFLKVGKDRGWEVTGIEPGKHAYQFSTQKLGLDIFNGFFSVQNHKDFGTFDVVHINNVLEHITDPRQFLKLTYGILNPYGLICVTVPNDFNPLQKIIVDLYKKDRWWVSPKEHVNYFNMDSLSFLMKSSGFEPFYRTASFPLEFFILMGDDYIGDNSLGRKIHARRKHFDLNFDKAGATNKKREIYNTLAKLGLGREITFIGRKSDKHGTTME
jgi:SAM-dependent methyltransferase